MGGGCDSPGKMRVTWLEDSSGKGQEYKFQRYLGYKVWREEEEWLKFPGRATRGRAMPITELGKVGSAN